MVQLRTRVTFYEFTASFQTTTQRIDRGAIRPSTNSTRGPHLSPHAVCWYLLLAKEPCRQNTPWPTTHVALSTMHMELVSKECNRRGCVKTKGVLVERQKLKNMMDSGRFGATCIELCRVVCTSLCSVGWLEICVRWDFQRSEIRA